ncbi:MAG TPA: carboxymuconolactone decarboxylase family protein [bacterium]|nr:carboxymuconolactone decarboxylase family protein [bacterium]
MNDHVKELVCISASVAGHCRPCFQYHFKKAREFGVPVEDIKQAIAIAKEISAAGDKHIVEFAQNITEKFDRP